MHYLSTYIPNKNSYPLLIKFSTCKQFKTPSKYNSFKPPYTTLSKIYVSILLFRPIDEGSSRAQKGTQKSLKKHPPCTKRQIKLCIL